MTNTPSPTTPHPLPVNYKLQYNSLEIQLRISRERSVQPSVKYVDAKTESLWDPSNGIVWIRACF